MPGSGDAGPRPIRAQTALSETPSLAALIIEFLAAQPGQPFAPWQIAEGVQARLTDRTVGVGAVLTTSLYLAAQGRLVQVNPAPKTYALVARAQGQAGQR